MPSYQHARFVGRAIESVLTQSFQDFELIITDDASTDDSVAVIRSYDDPRISLEVHSENRGTAVAKNAALARARGAYLAFLNSDDAFLPGKLELQLDFMRANPEIAALFGLPRFIGEDDQPLQPAGRAWFDVFRAPFEEGLKFRTDWLRRFFLKGNCLCMPTAMVRRDIYVGLSGFDHRMANVPDLDMWVRLCLEHEIRVLDRELTAMRIFEGDRNMSAPRRDTRLRAATEFFFVLRHYRRLSLGELREVFAPELASRPDLGAERDPAILLAELALMSPRAANQLFGLVTMFEAIEQDRSRSMRLIALAGTADPFGIEFRAEALRLKQELKSAKAEIAGLQRELAAAADRGAGSAG
jgi:glycosyltransferase involved in cell wall biosynthesis